MTKVRRIGLLVESSKNADLLLIVGDLMRGTKETFFGLDTVFIPIFYR